MLVSDASKFLNVEHIDCWVGDCFAEKQFRVRSESLFDFLFRSILVDECGLNAKFAQGDVEKIISSAIDLSTAHHVVASLADVENGIKVSRLPRRCEHRSHATFECGYFCSHRIVCRVL